VATVIFSSGLRPLVDGLEQLEIDATRVMDLTNALVERFPALKPQLEQMAVAIDGQIHNDARFQPLQPSSEVHFVPKIGGG
jgi:molybdopterin converting factor small subunit